jgi:hypothetical protein
MTQRIKIMTATFIGLHIPLVIVLAASLLLQIEQAGLIIGLVFMSTLLAVVITLSALWTLLPREAAMARMSYGN